MLISAFEAVVIGGIGSLWGTLLGGILLGLAQSLGALVSPAGFQLGGHLLFLAVLGARLWAQHRAAHGRPAWPWWVRRAGAQPGSAAAAATAAHADTANTASKGAA